MNKKGFYILLFSLINAIVYGQQLQWQGGSGYLAVNSYSGATTPSPIAILKIDGAGKVNFQNWKISVKIVNYPVGNGSDVFPADKISFLPIETWGSLTGPIPTISQIGMPLSVPLGSGEMWLIPSSNAAIINESTSGYNFNISFNLKVASGSYLNALQAWRQYSFTCEYTLYDGNNTIVGKLQNVFLIQVGSLSGTPPVDEGQYSIQVVPPASLEFSSISDYIGGKSVSSGLSVSATTAYQVKVKSVDPLFSSATSGNTITLDLDVVRLQLSGGSVNIPLSQTQQTILTGASTGGTPVNFDIIYSIEGNNPKLFNVPPDQYQTSLEYEISPQ